MITERQQHVSYKPIFYLFRTFDADIFFYILDYFVQCLSDLKDGCWWTVSSSTGDFVLQLQLFYGKFTDITDNSFYEMCVLVGSQSHHSARSLFS